MNKSKHYYVNMLYIEIPPNRIVYLVTSQVPLMGVFTTIVLVSSVVVFIINLSRGTSLTYSQLFDYDQFTIGMLECIERNARLYLSMAIFVLILGIFAFVMDFVICNHLAAGSGQVERSCVGVFSCRMVSDPLIKWRNDLRNAVSFVLTTQMILVLFATLVVCVWQLTNAIAVELIYRLMYDQCAHILTFNDTYCFSFDEFPCKCIRNNLSALQHSH